MRTLFWLFASLITWHVAGYGVFLGVLGRFRRRPRRLPEGDLPPVSILITAYNEEEAIAERIRNCLCLDYPFDRLEIVVCSDASTDRTAQIARSIEGVVVVESEARHRARTQALGVSRATGEVIFFTDADTVYDPDCVRKMVSHYADPKVGGVAGHLVFRDTGGASLGGAHGTYWRWDSLLRRLQSRIGVLLKLSGANMSVRKALYRMPPPGVDIDQAVGPELALQGYRVVADPEAIAHDVLPATVKDEWASRRRFAVQGLTALVRYPSLLNPLRHPVHAFHLFSYRLLRYVMPFLLLGLLAVSLALSRSSVLFASLAGAQGLFYAAAGIARGMKGRQRVHWVFRAAYALCVFQIGILVGAVEFACGRRIDAYVPTKQRGRASRS